VLQEGWRERESRSHSCSRAGLALPRRGERPIEDVTATATRSAPSSSSSPWLEISTLVAPSLPHGRKGRSGTSVAVVFHALWIGPACSALLLHRAGSSTASLSSQRRGPPLRGEVGEDLSSSCHSEARELPADVRSCQEVRRVGLVLHGAWALPGHIWQPPLSYR
jgi:hypothetical protein